VLFQFFFREVQANRSPRPFTLWFCWAFGMFFRCSLIKKAASDY
jgi:hypothetical protein